MCFGYIEHAETAADGASQAEAAALVCVIAGENQRAAALRARIAAGDARTPGLLAAAALSRDRLGEARAAPNPAAEVAAARAAEAAAQQRERASSDVLTATLSVVRADCALEHAQKDQRALEGMPDGTPGVAQAAACAVRAAEARAAAVAAASRHGVFGFVAGKIAHRS